MHCYIFFNNFTRLLFKFSIDMKSDYTEELITIRVLSRILGIYDEKDLKIILRKTNVNPHYNKLGLITTKYYMVKDLLKNNFISEVNSRHPDLEKEHIHNLISEHAVIVMNKKKLDEEAVLKIKINPAEEVRKLKIKIKENKKQKKELYDKDVATLKYIPKRKLNPHVFDNNPKVKINKIQRELELKIKKRKQRLDKNKILYKTDIKYKLMRVIYSMFRAAMVKEKQFIKLKGYKLLGCSIHEFKRYLESFFYDGMNWDKYMSTKDYWLRYKIPFHAFDLRKKEAQEYCFNYKNMHIVKKEKPYKGKINFDYLVEVGINPDILKKEYEYKLKLLYLKLNKKTANE